MFLIEMKSSAVPDKKGSVGHVAFTNLLFGSARDIAKHSRYDILYANPLYLVTQV